MDNIIIADNLIGPDECMELINFYNENTSDSWKHNEQFPITIYGEDKYLYDNEQINKTIDKIQNFAQSIHNDIKIDWANIVRWPTKSWQHMHLDTQSRETTFTSILYLNSNFRGGETRLLDGTHIAPVPGRMFCFDGAKYEHAVEHVVSGDRYTIAAWYKKIQ